MTGVIRFGGLGAALADPDAWAELTETLGAYSLLRREPAEGAVTGYSVHRVVQEVMRDRMAAEGVAARWLAGACDVADAAFPFYSDKLEFWGVSEALLPHAREVREHVRDAGSPASLGRLLNQASIYLRVRSLYGEARDFRELALESELRQFGPDHPNVAASRSNLANILRDLGEHAGARKQIEFIAAEQTSSTIDATVTMCCKQSRSDGLSFTLEVNGLPTPLRRICLASGATLINTQGVGDIPTNHVPPV